MAEKKTHLDLHLSAHQAALDSLPIENHSHKISTFSLDRFNAEAKANGFHEDDFQLWHQMFNTLRGNYQGLKRQATPGELRPKTAAPAATKASPANGS